MNKKIVHTFKLRPFVSTGRRRQAIEAKNATVPYIDIAK